MGGIVEPISGKLMASFMPPILPYLLSLSTGAIIYVVIEELIPEELEAPHSNISTIGFTIMIILDVMLSE